MSQVQQAKRVLYGYWRSSAAYRVRIALNLKGLAYQSQSVHLVRDGGEQHQSKFKALNASELVPVFVDPNMAGELQLNQSLAIIQYLDEQYSTEIKLLPKSTPKRYQALALAHDIAMEIHPLNNLRVLQYLEGVLECNSEQKQQWLEHWMHKGFRALEIKLNEYAQQYQCTYSISDSPSIVDLCLVPQVYNAKRFGLDLSTYPRINAIVNACQQLPAFIEAAPENQADAG